MELESTPPPHSLIATTSDGRVRYSAEQRNHLLDLFEQSGMTGKAFAEQHGVKYPTFALWRKRRRDDRATSSAPGTGGFVVAEVSTRSSQANQIRIELPGGASLTVQNAAVASLAAAVLKQLSLPESC